jgi:hypothetical protein
MRVRYAGGDVGAAHQCPEDLQHALDVLRVDS